jgi:hypothetical protein
MRGLAADVINLIANNVQVTARIGFNNYQICSEKSADTSNEL